MIKRFWRLTSFRFFAIAALVVVLLYVTVVRSYYYQPASHERSMVGEAWLTKGFEVAVVWPEHGAKDFNDGVQLAWEEINAGKSVLAGKIRLRQVEETDASQKVATRVARYPNVVAVLGHEFSSAAIPASVEYEEHGILFLTPSSTSPRLTSHAFDYVFRLTPDDTAIADAMVKFAVAQGYKRVGVLFQRNEGGESAATQFQAKAEEYGVSVPFMRSYLGPAQWETHDYRPLIAGIRREQVDAVMIGDQMPQAAKLLKDLIVMNMRTPILATDKFDRDQLWQLAGTAANNVYVASAVDPSSASDEYVAFRRRFMARYGIEPNYSASQGYDALTLLANAIVKSGEADPITVATTLRTNTWKGLFGEYTLDQSGDVVGRRVSIKRMLNGTFTTVQQ